ncbi:MULTISPECIES: GLPGLI family protein [Tenacibaculum]|uniref:GLPGLI family protein n=1 Tax=Tenacibaculum TaxID=104267 RepID=UPI001F0A351C|nr:MULTISPECIES: GLPGLI family protein [Tenacibaculum]MCH3881569.1 GLPGLI family protein [Tenacibaculum aquimarinum]MDO6598836.1 GLPGLI family protein [Tenacibaculum sp. 1_MG-2023]
MKKITYLFFIISFQVISQSGIITYNAKVDFEQTNPQAKAISDEIKLMSFTLKYNNLISHFKKSKNIPLNNMMASYASVLIEAKNNWFQNAIKKESFYKKEIKSESYLVNHDSKMSDWVLTNKSKIIDGYTCYKAERKEFNSRSGKNILITAWFSPDIPYPYGPIGNGGLPGLILQLKRHKRVTYTVNKIILNPKKITIPKIPKGEKVTIKEVIKKSRDARKYTVD